MSHKIEHDEHISWFSYLFPSHEYGWVVVVSAGVTTGLFVFGYVIWIAGGTEIINHRMGDPQSPRLLYLARPEPYLGALGVFC